VRARVTVTRLGLVAVVALAVAAAATRGWAQGIEVQVTSVVPRWSYIEATLGVRPRPIRFFFPDDDACRALLLRETNVLYASRGPLGVVTNAAGDRCEPVGIASLQEWRDRSSRRRTATPVPRAQATFTVVQRDGGLVFARGRFPLATLLDWTNADDTIALLPNDQSCRRPIDAGVATMEFRFSGRDPYRLVAGGERCTIVGFVRPLPSGE
jgi:hypothetical protein